MHVNRFKIDNNQGFSLVENVLAILLVGVVSISGFTMINFYKKKTSFQQGSCRVHAQSVLSRIQGIGLGSQIANFAVHNATRNMAGGAAAAGLFSATGVTNADRWPGTNFFEAPIPAVGTPASLRNALLINSSVSAIQSIYNSAAAGPGHFCNTFRAYAPIVDPAMNPPGREFTVNPPLNPAPQTTIRIQPYDLRTGQIVPDCATVAPPLYIRPPGDGASSAFTSAPPKATADANYRADLGFLVTVRTTYMDQDRIPRDCRAEQRFQYVADTSIPVAPNFSTIARLTGPVVYEAGFGCSSTNSYQVNIGYNTAGPDEPERGSVLVCRDISENPVERAVVFPDNTNVDPSFGTGTGYINQCFNGPGNSGGLHFGQKQVGAGIYGSASLYYPPTGTNTGMLYTGATTVVAAQFARWVPCDRVTACGVAPTTVTIVGGDERALRPQYQIVYNNITPGCRVRIEVATIDTAGNTSSTFINAASQSTSDNTITWDVAIPKCSSYCGAAWPNGYYSCGGC